MTRDEFAMALRQLGLPHSSRLTARLLGVSTRQVFRWLAGRNQVTPSVGTMLALLLILNAGGLPPAAVWDMLQRKRRPGSNPETPLGLNP
jgi:hypothetical protein